MPNSKLSDLKQSPGTRLLLRLNAKVDETPDHPYSGLSADSRYLLLLADYVAEKEEQQC